MHSVDLVPIILVGCTFTLLAGYLLVEFVRARRA